MYELFIICNVTKKFGLMLKSSVKFAWDLDDKGRGHLGTLRRQAGCSLDCQCVEKAGNGVLYRVLGSGLLIPRDIPVAPGSPACNSCYLLAPPTF